MMPVPSPKAQIITISPNGTISGLERKKSEGIDLKKFGHANVVRASSIEWHEENDMCRGYKIMFLNGKRKGSTLTKQEYERYYTTYLPCIINSEDNSTDIALFDDYSDCVNVEIAILDADRISGHW